MFYLIGVRQSVNKNGNFLIHWCQPNKVIFSMMYMYVGRAVLYTLQIVLTWSSAYEK